MSSPRYVMALLAVFALSAKVAECAIAAPALCAATDIGKDFCIDCKTTAKCVTPGKAPTLTGECIDAGEACTVLAGVAICGPIAQTACSCDKPAQCDAYDPDSVLICLSGDVTVINDCSVSSQTCVDGACDTDVCTGVLVNTFAVIKPKCTTAAYCVGGASAGTTDCGSGTYFDMDKLACMPLPPVPCADCDTGACPDKSDCSKWYVCQGGNVVHEDTCEVPTPDFDTVSKVCVATGSGGVCTLNDGCTYDLTTTVQTTTTTVSSSDGSSTSSGSVSTTTATESTAAATTTTTRPAECTAANKGERYPYEGNCKMYWTCLQVSSGEYNYVTSTCLGSYEFNPSTSYCDLPANVIPPCVSTP